MIFTPPRDNPGCNACPTVARWSVCKPVDADLNDVRVTSFACGRHLNVVLLAHHLDDGEPVAVYDISGPVAS